MRPWKPNYAPELETFMHVPVWIPVFSLPIDYWRPAALEQIGNTLGTFIQAFKATLQKRYTYCACICVEMDVSGALHDGLWLEFRDVQFFQAIDYEQIPFRCRKCHEHGHLFREFPTKKMAEKPKETPMNIQDGFACPNGRHRANRKAQPKAGPSFRATQNTFEILTEEFAAYDSMPTSDQ